MKIVEKEWLEYVKVVLPADVLPGSVQYIETKRAFYGGAGSVTCELVNKMKKGELNASVDSVIDEVREFCLEQVRYRQSEN